MSRRITITRRISKPALASHSRPTVLKRILYCQSLGIAPRYPRSVAHPLECLGDQVVTDDASHNIHGQLEQPEETSWQPSRPIALCLVGVSDSVDDPRNTPAQTSDSGRDRESQATNEHSRDDAWQVLEVVAVGALCAVEQVHGLLLLWVGGAHLSSVGVWCWVSESGALAEHSHASTVPETEEECAGDGQDSVSGESSASLQCACCTSAEVSDEASDEVLNEMSA